MKRLDLKIGESYLNGRGEKLTIISVRDPEEDFDFEIFTDDKGFEYIYSGEELMSGGYVSSSNKDNLIIHIEK